MRNSAIKGGGCIVIVVMLAMLQNWRRVITLAGAGGRGRWVQPPHSMQISHLVYADILRL